MVEFANVDDGKKARAYVGTGEFMARLVQCLSTDGLSDVQIKGMRIVAPTLTAHGLELLQPKTDAAVASMGVSSIKPNDLSVGAGLARLWSGGEWNESPAEAEARRGAVHRARAAAMAKVEGNTAALAVVVT